MRTICIATSVFVTFNAANSIILFMRYLFFFCFCMTTCAASINAQEYIIYRNSDREQATLTDVVGALQEGSILVFGEQHDDSIAHVLELSFWQAIHQKFGTAATLSLEMFERDVQGVLDEYLMGLISEKNFRKEARAWNNYDDYQPLVAYAKENRLKVTAANTPARYVNRVTRLGLGALTELDKIAKKNFLPPLPVDTLGGKYAALFAEIMGGHEMSGMHLYQSQNLWDATMAWSIHQVMRENKRSVVFQVNGKFHSDFHTGLVERLVRQYGHKVVSISCIPVVDITKPDWQKLAGIADFVILTASSPATP